MFESLQHRVLPQDDPPVIELPHTLGSGSMIDARGNIPANHNIPVSLMPKRFQDFQLALHLELSGLLTGFVQTIHWAQQAVLKQQPYLSLGFQRSNDNTAWTSMPSSTRVRMSFELNLDTGPRALAFVKTLFGSGEREPLGHELIREAREIAGSNQRSALLIGVTAVETGLKAYIQFRMPNAEFLLDKMPSPSAYVMAQEVIPNLHKVLKIKQRAFPLPDAERILLQKWVHQRNLVAHGGKRNLDQDGLITFLNFARSLLYKLDVCRGHDWASRFVDEVTEPATSTK
jgi:hypothetical protein